jgi:hypothetical protein
MKNRKLFKPILALIFSVMLCMSFSFGVWAETADDAAATESVIVTDENGEPVAPSPAPGVDENGVQPKTIIFIAVGVVLLAVIVFFLMKTKSGDSAPAYTQETYEMPTQPDFPMEDVGATTPVMYDDVDVGKTMPAEANKPIRVEGIRGTGGEYNLKTFNIKDNCKIGRDPEKANIIYKGTAGGVSGLHCELQRVGDGIQIQDRASTYGTFVNGVKLTVGVPVDLKPGDTISIGSDKNTFVAF